MTPLYLTLPGGHCVAAIYEPATGAPKGTGVLLVPPFGWDDQTSYRPRRDWSRALAANGFGTLRIDLPGTGDSSGTPHDKGLVEAWTEAVSSGVEWLRASGATRIAVIALGAGGLITLQAMASGTRIDDLVLWGMPATGRAFLREFKAFGRLEQFQTGERTEDALDAGLRAGGHVLAPGTVASVTGIDACQLIAAGAPERVLILGRDGTGPDEALISAFRAAGAEVQTDPGRGWGAALARAQSTSPVAIFQLVNASLAKTASPGEWKPAPAISTAELRIRGARVRETPLKFEADGRQLYAVLAEPVDAPLADGTLVLFNAGAIRRIGPNRMWTEAARRWAAAGVPVLRIDLEGIGDAGGDSCGYAQSDEAFYTKALVQQARTALELAAERGLPQRFVLAGLCSGAFWAFHVALADPRVEAVVALNPRMLIFDAQLEGLRDLRRMRRIATLAGIRNILSQKRKLRRLSQMLLFLLKSPLSITGRRHRNSEDQLTQAVRTVRERGQRIHVAFCGAEPLEQELRQQGKLDALEAFGVTFHQLPCTSHTLKPLAAQRAAHALIDAAIEETVAIPAPKPMRSAARRLAV